MFDIMNGSHYGWMSGGMWFFPVLFWALIIAGAVFLFRRGADQNRGGSTNAESALDILKKRYAKGEIDEETFKRMKQEIDEHD